MARTRMLEFIGEARLALTTVTIGLAASWAQERARALSLERLLWELMQSRTQRIVLESRQMRNNSRDRRTILAAMVAGKAARDLTYAFGLPLGEPLLWMADAVASAVATADYTANDTLLVDIATALLRVRL